MLAEKDAPRTSETCFANPVVADVIESGRKIAGRPSEERVADSCTKVVFSEAD